jgi:glycosyltransferase involved in cell wall biosynthesis
MEIPYLARGADLLHCPHYEIPALYRRPLSVTIHDLTHLLDPAFKYTFKSRLFARALMQRAVNQARRIITVSHYSKQRLIEHLGADHKKISVIHNYASAVFAPMLLDAAKEAVRTQLGIYREYFLFVGNPKPHKNLPVLFQALALLRAKNREAPQLVVIGRDEKNEPELRKLAVELGIDNDVRWIEFFVPDEVLRACYAAAVATILPSRQEGFGLPVIESMSCGTPVICSDAASLPEVAGGCALLFDPSSPEACCERLSQVLDSSELRALLKAKGLERGRDFEAARAVKEHAQVFAELLSN